MRLKFDLNRIAREEIIPFPEQASPRGRMMHASQHISRELKAVISSHSPAVTEAAGAGSGLAIRAYAAPGVEVHLIRDGDSLVLHIKDAPASLRQQLVQAALQYGPEQIDGG